ncbi:hypothetical protein [Phenylobacterium sp.]|uniref:hypothetical protein n=1 Tax=Phenylobacterium sp. TaxID=1871053 RepID=UPI0027316B12|nr:hypothetical protein [Phenylobacterium sp.]MDP1875144.1 hypothetical protein [Phenylobacterium sp.]
MSGTLWSSDFHVEGGRVKVRATGADLALDRALFTDIRLWLGYYVPVRLMGLWTRLTRPGPKVWFTPNAPRPWYLLGLAVFWGGVRIARSPGDAQAAVYFEDSTVGRPPACDVPQRFNFDCTDVSKSHVARVFEAVFGYPLTVNPMTWTGPVVEKGEGNGAHDGRIVQGPCPAAPGRVYQRVIDTVDGGHVVDLRTPCVGGTPVMVFIKRRPVRDRFANYNSSVSLHRPGDIFSPEELAVIERFCAAMRLDWGGLDILRDSADGRLYIVDVNKTDMPPLRLPWTQKMQAIARLSRAFLAMINGESARGGA